MVDFHKIMARARELCPDVYVYAKPITGRPAEVIPYLEQDFWKAYPRARAADLARFLSLAKKGVPYDKPIVNEDLRGRRLPDYLIPAIQVQQRDHMERSLEYAKEVLDLGVRWRAELPLLSCRTGCPIRASLRLFQRLFSARIRAGRA